ncbi:37417_t:CDS:2 [Gigaspora margarita]|uniref:37417_t:CDS:1 n=1 Tax=Gigaspora margarita TaxID=4874 RepID=A0ABM8W032_GIGMA|nr:37417_t:CDS:2 [Gigaspora margarita]
MSGDLDIIIKGSAKGKLDLTIFILEVIASKSNILITKQCSTKNQIVIANTNFTIL